MNPITKAIVSNKLSNVGKSFGLESDSKGKDDNDESLSAKDLRKIEAENAAARAKLKEEHAKRNAEREKKREEIRAKYGLKEGKNSRGSVNKGTISGTETNTSRKDGDEKQCCIM